MVDLQEATERVFVLESFPFEDGQPNVEGLSLSVLYQNYIDYNFADRAAFDVRWAEDVQTLSQLRELLKTGDQYVNMLYTYRSCSKALPQVKTSDQPNKNEIYEGTYDVLEPEIKKLKNFMYFQRDTVKVFCDHVKKITSYFDKKKNKEEDSPSESYLWLLIQLLDRFALLDALKNMKACLNNDFSFYKRSFGFLRRNLSATDDQTQENHTLYLFLAHQNSITTNLKTEIQQIPGFEDVLAALLNQCAKMLENNEYLTPYEKHAALRVLPYGLILMDGDANTPYNIFKSKKINLKRFASLFKKYPVVPLYGDMQINLEAPIRHSPHFDQGAWGGTPDDAKSLAVEYDLLSQLENIRQSHNDFLAKFASLMNRIRAARDIPFEFAKEISQTILNGFQLLSDWSSKILQQAAWKYANPNNDNTIEVTTEYERVVRFNYNPDQKFALIEVIAMIKGLAHVMLREEGRLSLIIRNYIHDEVQDFIQRGLREIIRQASKKKKLKNTKDELMILRSLTADWLSGSEPVDPSLTGKSKSKKEESIQIPSRSVGPSPTQIELLRINAFALLDKKKELESSQVKILEDFYNNSKYYERLLNYGGTIVEITDLGDLWYREFFLELTKRLQFPIDMSLPWILTDHILESKEPSMMEYLLIPLDLYNDSGHRALNALKQQFLYDEIEAEVNLCFDQLVFKLSEQIYTHFKTQASSILLDKPYKFQLEQVYSSYRLNVPQSRYDVILKQRHVKLLGRSVNLNELIAQRMNTYLRQNVEHAISRFEASNLTSVVELEHLLNNIKFTYMLLSEHFHLDPWDSIFNEVNESTSIVSFHGRIILHIIYELMYDFAPNWNFNSITNRFVQTPLAFSEEVPRDAIPRSNQTFLYGSKVLNIAYQGTSTFFTTFFGMAHIESILRLVGRSNLPLIISESLQNMDLKLRNVLVPYVKELMGGMPPSSKLPIHDYGTEGGYGYFQLKLKDIIKYPDLRPEVLQNFREFGNIILFMKMCDLAMSQLDSSTFILAAPFLGITTDSTSNDSAQTAPLYTAVQDVATVLEKNPAGARAPSILRELTDNALKTDKLYRPLPQNLSLFKSFLQKVSDMLQAVRPLWSGTAPDNGVLAVDSTTEFYRLWSGLQFVCCLPTGENELSNHELFGDGLLWAACAIIHFLGQQQRFEVFDFSYHILNVEESSVTPCTNPSMQQFFKKVRLWRDINSSIFSTLQAFCNPPTENPLQLHPPSSDDTDQFIDASKKTGAVRTPSVRLNLNDDAPPPPPSDDPPPPPDM